MTDNTEFINEFASLKNQFSLMEPELEITIRDPEMDVEGYIVVWNTKISLGGILDGCGKGGTRVTKDLKLEDIKRLAKSMAEKNAAAGLPLGGAKSGLRCDPNDPNYEVKYKRFVELSKPYLRENGGIFGGFGYDVGCIPPKNAIWACDQLGSTKSFTGKPVNMGGTDYDKEGIAGLGVAVAGRALLGYKGIDVKGATFSVQGIGAMGAAVLKCFSEYGGTIKSISDPKYGGTWLFKGIISEELLKNLINQNLKEAIELLNIEAVKISDDSNDALYQDVDIIFPCALEDAINKDNVGKIKAKYISEGANNPTSDEAHKILYDKGVMVIPDIIANPGGIIAAFVELTSNVTIEENIKTRAKVIEAKNMTEKKVIENTNNLLDMVNKVNISPDQVGDYIAYKNIFCGLKG